MKVGIYGCGTVGGTLKRWLEENTDHEIAVVDPGLNINDDMKYSDAIFICVPYGAKHKDSIVIETVYQAKKHTQNVFIKSTVLPGTNDSLNTVSMPEFLTARRPYLDFQKHPIMCGPIPLEFVQRLFPNKEIIQGTNLECEISKYMHNCFGATKVTYFNMFKRICDFYNTNFDNTKVLANHSTGYLGTEHLQVPGHDGKLGYGGTCFPINMETLEKHLDVINKHQKLKQDFGLEKEFISLVRTMNLSYRGEE
jgi:UDPglucose 6-dehydrogenase